MADESTMLYNEKWILVTHPQGPFRADEHAKLVKEDIKLDDVNFNGHSNDSLSLGSDYVVVKVGAVSIDAFIRTTLDPSAYHGKISSGDTLPAIGIGTVLKAGPDAKFKKNSTVVGMLGACKYALISSNDLQSVRRIPGIKDSLYLGYMGISGLTAYIGMFVAPPKCPQKGETVVVSAASGAVGSIAVQMAKQCGAKVVGIAGGEKKCNFLNHELFVDAAIDYKSTDKSVQDQLDWACPDGIDFFFDNVGGDILDAVLERMNRHARVVICGAASQYSNGNINTNGSIVGPSNYVKIAERSASMVGFNMMHYPNQQLKGVAYLWWQYVRGNMKAFEDVTKGIKEFAPLLEAMFKGSERCGRLVVDFSDVSDK